MEVIRLQAYNVTYRGFFLFVSFSLSNLNSLARLRDVIFDVLSMVITSTTRACMHSFVHRQPNPNIQTTSTSPAKAQLSFHVEVFLCPRSRLRCIGFSLSLCLLPSETPMVVVVFVCVFVPFPFAGTGGTVLCLSTAASLPTHAARGLGGGTFL